MSDLASASAESAASPAAGLLLHARALLDEFTQFFKYFIAVEQFSACSLCGAACQFGFQFLKSLRTISLLPFQEPQGFTDDFAGGLIPS